MLTQKRNRRLLTPLILISACWRVGYHRAKRGSIIIPPRIPTTGGAKSVFQFDVPGSVRWQKFENVADVVRARMRALSH